MQHHRVAYRRPRERPHHPRSDFGARCGSGSTTTTCGCRARAAGTSTTRNRHEFYAQVRRINQLLHGIGEATMTHGEAWEFFQPRDVTRTGSPDGPHPGREVPPAAADSSRTSARRSDNAHWMAILKSCSGYEPFHKKPRPLPVEPGTAGGGVSDLRRTVSAVDPAVPEGMRNRAAAAAGIRPGRAPTGTRVEGIAN